jgi:hypothetical protein
MVLARVLLLLLRQLLLVLLLLLLLLVLLLLLLLLLPASVSGGTPVRRDISGVVVDQHIVLYLYRGKRPLVSVGLTIQAVASRASECVDE